MTRAPREEVTVNSADVLETVRTVYRRRPMNHNERLDAAHTTIAHIAYQQGYKTALWLVPAEPLWIIAYLVPAHHAYPGADDTHPAVTAQNALRAALKDQAPATCRALSKQAELGEIATCGHCKTPWSLTHTCAGQPEPVLTVVEEPR